jgi:hypothetical protein
MSSAAQAVRGFYSSLIAGDSTGLMFLFGGPPKIDTPVDGNVEGSASFQRFVIDQRKWLGAREAEVENIALTETDKCAVAEIVLNLKQENEAIQLPVALVADIAGGMVTWLRIYHSTWPLTGSHRVRGPLMKRATRLAQPETIKTYMSGIRKPHKDKVLSLFAEDGYVREPSGGDYKHTGSEELDQFYSVALATGGIPLAHCSATFDGTCCAIEYNCDSWGSSTIPPQAGCAVYEMNKDEQLVGVRIYDDITSPSEKAS